MYLNLLMMFLAAGFIGAAALAVGGLMGPKKGSENKLAAYESGVPASGSARERFPRSLLPRRHALYYLRHRDGFLLPAGGSVPRRARVFVRAGDYFCNHVLGVGYVYILKKGVLHWQ